MDDPSPRPLSAQGPLAVSSTNPRYFSVGPNDREAIYLTGSHVWNNLHDGMGPGGGCADARGGGLQYTSSASATLSFSGDHIAWIGSKGSDHGSAKDYLDGVLRSTINCNSSRTQRRQVLLKYRWPSVGNHTIQVVNQATSGHPRIDVDGFVTFS